jgi:hypothetical protein
MTSYHRIIRSAANPTEQEAPTRASSIDAGSQTRELLIEELDQVAGGTGNAVPFLSYTFRQVFVT